MTTDMSGKRACAGREGAEQEVVFQWAALQTGRWPCLAWLHHIPNGGSRHPAEAAKLRRQGAKAGLSDICLPWPSGPYHGLYIELKAGSGRATPAQAAFIAYLRAAGYRAEVCRGAREAIRVIQGYLEGEQNG